MAKRVDVILEKDGDCRDAVAFFVKSPDGADLTAQEILEAVAEAILIHWDNHVMQKMDYSEYDA